MSSRATLVLLALLAALGAAALLLEGPWGADRVRDHARVFPGLTAERVRALTIARAGAQLLLSREGEAWMLGEERQAADGAAVEALLAELATLEVSAVVSKNAAKQAVYETDAEKGIAVRLLGDGGAVLAAFTVGKRGPDFQSAFLKRDGEKEVVLVSRDVRTPLARPDWKQPAKP